MTRCHVFLWCWIGLYLVLFTAASTKLPNYILPVYPAFAILMARFLERWRTGGVSVPGWVISIGLTCLALIGVTIVVGLLVAGGSLEVPFYSGRQFAGLSAWAYLGLIPLGGAALAWWSNYRRRPAGVLASVLTTSIVLVGLLALGPGRILNGYKAPRSLAEAVQTAQSEREIRVACYQYFQPSFVFYCQRKVDMMENEEQTMDFLRSPLPVYLCLPATVWEEMQSRVAGQCRVLDRQHDLYRKYDVVVVTNR